MRQHHHHRHHQPPPQSCDTFAYIGAATSSSFGIITSSSSSSGTLFGKNSDRPSSEQHEVIWVPARSHYVQTTVQCTYISVPQAEKTLGCILSRPSWMWGCEMGANEAGVVGGNEAIHTLLSDDLLSPTDGTTPQKRLLGMDLLRLSLERGTSAKHALEICIHFLETFGQGGPCSMEGGEESDWTYENSFLFADSQEGYVLETAGIDHWAWERFGPGEYKNISNGISIRTNWGAVSKNIRNVCKERGWWDGGTLEFDWKRAVGAGGRAHANLEAGGREAAGGRHLQRMKETSDSMISSKTSTLTPRWWVEQMAGVLRDEDSGICFRDVFGGFCSTGSQISWLPSSSASDSHSVQNGMAASHFFTGASDPLCGTPYKLFRFSSALMGEHAALNDHGTKKLWDLRRDRALNRVPAEQSLLDALSKIEEESFYMLDCVSGTSDKEGSVLFVDMVKREIDMLINCSK